MKMRGEGINRTRKQINGRNILQSKKREIKEIPDEMQFRINSAELQRILFDMCNEYCA
jgi:hypothetical protein